MLYLASQFAWFLLAAFALGAVMGWIGQDGDERGFRSRALAFVAAGWLLGAALTWTQTLNGVAALRVESALLFVAIYLAGCAAAAALKPVLDTRPIVPAGMTRDGPAVVLAGATPVPVPGVENAPALVDDGKTIIRGLVKAADSPPEVENEAALPGQRPSGLATARSATPDDLKLIKGIGPQNEGRLHGLGIWHFDQIAAWTPDNVEWVGSYLAFPGRIERENWVAQAQARASGVEKKRGGS